MKKNIKKGYIEESFDIFNYKNLGKVRTFIDENHDKWFSLKDICDILGIVSPWNVTKRIPDPHLCSIEVGLNTGFKADGTPAMQNIPMNFVNEAGLYLAIGQSRKPEAKELILWIFGEVLPTLNKKGYYIMDNKPESEVIEELQHKIKSLELEQRHLRNVIYFDKESVLSYAEYYGYDVSNPILLKRLDVKCKRLAEDSNEPITVVSSEIGTTMYRHNTVKYIFDKYYRILEEAIEKGENYYAI